MEQKVIGFGQNTFLVKIYKFSITAGVTCLRLRIFLNKKCFFPKMEQKLIGFGHNTFLFNIYILLIFSILNLLITNLII